MTVVRRGEKYGVKVWDKGHGKYVWLGTFDSEQEARKAEADASFQAGKGTPMVEQWGRMWLSDYAREAPATRLVYRQAVKKITSAIGNERMGDVGRAKARKLALGWPRNVSAVAGTMWADALRDGICRENPWTNMRIPQSRGRKDIQPLTEKELHELAHTAQRVHKDYGAEARAIILVLGYTGIRPGELCALKHEDLDLANSEIHIRRSRDVTGAEKAPKNGKHRVITIPPVALSALKTLFPNPDGYVFHTQRGKRFSKANLSYFWRPIKTAWIEQGQHSLDLYSLRHCCATMLLERGMDAATVAVQLGHTDGGSLVLERYGHPSAERARDRLKMAWATAPERLTDATRSRRAS